MGGSGTHRTAPYLVTLVPGHRERHLGLFAGDNIFSGGKEKNFPYGGTQTAADCPCTPVLSPLASLLHPCIPLAFFHSPVQPNFFPSAGFSIPPLSLLINRKTRKRGTVKPQVSFLEWVKVQQHKDPTLTSCCPNYAGGSG